jgi:sec-independent protein translocase protein TatB
MFDIASSEFLLVMLVALVVIGPKDLPRVLSAVGKWVGKARGVAAQFRSGFDEMVRESELQDLEKKWKAENERIMQLHPPEPAFVEAAVEPEMETSAAKPKAPRKPRAKPKPKADPTT